MLDRLQEKEKFLYGVKWHDYRMLTPDTATLAFMNEFAKALTEFNEATGKSRYFSFLKNIASFEPERLKVKRSRFWNTMSQLRQWADGHGFDYADFWSWGFAAFNELGFRATYVNAFLNMKLKLKIKEKKLEYDRHFVKRSESPYFRAENFVGSEIQTDYYDYLIYKISDRNLLDKLADSGELHADYLSKCLDDRVEKETATA